MRKVLIPVIPYWTCLTMLFTFLANDAALADWKFAAEEKGIRIYTRPVSYSTVKEFKAITRLPAKLDSVLAVLLDPASCPEWVHRCKQARELKRNSFGEVYTYRIIDLPWPVSDRDIVLHKVVSYDPETKEILIRNEGVPDFIPKTGYVRIEKSSGTYRLKPLPTGEVELTWQQFSDPGGDLPKALINAMLTGTPMTTLENLHEMVKKKKYQSAKLRYTADGMLDGFEVKPW